MLMNFEIDNYVDKGVAIKVVGVGGGGACVPDLAFDGCRDAELPAYAPVLCCIRRVALA